MHSETTRKQKNLLMAAENCVTCLIGAMDRLWFHQIILFSEPPSLHFSENPQKSADYSSKISSQMSEEEISPVASVVTDPQDIETSSQESDDLDHKETTHHEERPTRLNLVSGKTRSHSSSPISAQKRSRNLARLQKTMSCKSLLELELEEVRGFMDLGFIFRRENLSKRIINLIPGLQRIDSSCKNDENGERESSEFSRNDDEEEEKQGKMRPYLSEAWTIKRPDSPLLNLRIPRVSTAADMKKHLKFWAQSVASAIQQES